MNLTYFKPIISFLYCLNLLNLHADIKPNVIFILADDLGYSQAILQGDWKCHLPRTIQQIPWWDKNNFSNIHLYNRKEDPAEKHNLADTYSEKVAMFTKLPKEAWENLGDYQIIGRGQRATGTLFPDIPVIENSKDWGRLPKNIKAKTLRK